LHVCLLEIDRFRGIKSAKVQLGQHVVLLGGNNVGKSAIIDALALLLGRRGLVRDLWEHDFFGSAPEASDRVQLRATITGFEPDDSAKHPFWFADGASHVWWLEDSGKVEFGTRPAGAKLAMQIGFSARFDLEIAEVVTERYFVTSDADSFQDDEPPVRAHHLEELGFFLLPSHRTWDRILSFSSELFRRTLTAEQAKPSAALLHLREYLRAPGAHLETVEGFKDVVQSVEHELASYVGNEEAHLAFMPTTTDTDGVLRALTPHLIGKAGAEAPAVPMGRQGSGVVSLQTILLLLEIGRRRRANGKPFILAAEEPELHLHPGHHRRLVARLRGVSDQTIVTTHSPEVAAYYRPQEIVILRNDKGELAAQPLLRGPTVPTTNALLRLFTLLRTDVCEALMHSVVIIPEGETEFRWFRGLIRACVTAEGGMDITEKDQSAFAASLGVLPTQSSHVVGTYCQFRPVISCLLPLADGDTNGRIYVQALKKLSPPPQRIARLGEGLVLETVLAWLLEPMLEGEFDWRTVKEVLDPASRTTDALAAALLKNKTRWDLHDHVLAAIASSKASARRARTFLNGLVNVAAGKLPSGGWAVAEGEAGCEVCVWNPPATVGNV
jgi:putative ATP-dependent endonuclease of OLD family